jgi:ABC-type branched-subunit amino acid transport system substrate-binding protein
VQFRGHRLVIAGLVGALSMTAAACGSQLSPDTVRAANGVAAGAAAQDGSLSGDTVAGGTGGPSGAAGTGAGTGSTGGTTGGSAGSGGGAATAAGTGGGTTKGGGVNAATGASKAGNCAGFKNQTGIDAKTITIANASDISGPVPGLFQSAQDATKAYVAYFNSGSDICGRKLSLESLDSRTDAAADQQSYAKACETSFAAVGSMSAFDSGGAATAQNCGLPDIRSAAVTPERSRCSTCFGAQSTNATQFQNAVPDYVLKNYHDASQHAAYLWINAGASPPNAKNQAAAMTKRGMKFVYQQGIDVSEFNYAPYVQQMKSKGVKYVQFLGAYQQAVRLAQAMQQQGFKPDVYMLDPTAYDPDYVQSGGSAVQGTTIFINFVPFAEARSSKEMELYQAWLQQVHPGAQPTFFGVFAWSAARLFVEEATKLGGRLTRQTLVPSLRSVDNWTGNGIHSTQHVGAKNTGDCWRFITLKGAKWVPTGGRKYTCNGTTTAVG